MKELDAGLVCLFYEPGLPRVAGVAAASSVIVRLHEWQLHSLGLYTC